MCESKMEWMRYLLLDQALALLSSEFELEKHLTLDQVCFYSTSPWIPHIQRSEGFWEST